jgi:hypothetical protein
MFWGIGQNGAGYEPATVMLEAATDRLNQTARGKKNGTGGTSAPAP